MANRFPSIPTKTLASSITAEATQFRLNNIKGWDGEDMTPEVFGDRLFAVLRNVANTRIEFVEIDPTTIQDTNIIILRRGMNFNGELQTEYDENKQGWTAGDTYVDLGTATPQLFQWFKDYIDNSVVAGAPPMEANVPGIGKTATSQQLNDGTFGDGTYPYVATSAQLATSKYNNNLPSSGEKRALAGSEGTPGENNRYVTEEGLIRFSFGDGEDGDVTVASGETVELSRDMYYRNLTIEGTINTNGWRIFVSETIDGGGQISFDGKNSSEGGGGVEGFFSSVEGGFRSQDRRSVDFSASEAAGGHSYFDGISKDDASEATPLTQKFGIFRSLSVLGVDMPSRVLKERTGEERGYSGRSDPDNFSSHSHEYTYSITPRINGGASGAPSASKYEGGAGGGVVALFVNQWNGSFDITARGGNGRSITFSSGSNDTSGGGGGGFAYVLYNQKTWIGNFDVSGGVSGYRDTDTNGEEGKFFESKLEVLL